MSRRKPSQYPSQNTSNAPSSSKREQRQDSNQPQSSSSGQDVVSNEESEIDQGPTRQILDDGPRSASHSPPSSPMAEMSSYPHLLRTVQLFGKPIWRVNPPKSQTPAANELCPKAKFVPKSEIVNYNERSPTKSVQLHYNVRRQNLTNSVETYRNSFAMREEYARSRRHRGWHARRSGATIIVKRRALSDTSENVVRYGPHITTRRFLARRHWRPDHHEPRRRSSLSKPLRSVAGRPGVRVRTSDPAAERHRGQALESDESDDSDGSSSSDSQASTRTAIFAPETQPRQRHIRFAPGTKAAPGTQPPKRRVSFAPFQRTQFLSEVELEEMDERMRQIERRRQEVRVEPQQDFAIIQAVTKVAKFHRSLRKWFARSRSSTASSSRAPQPPPAPLPSDFPPRRDFEDLVVQQSMARTEITQENNLSAPGEGAARRGQLRLQTTSRSGPDDDESVSPKSLGPGDAASSAGSSASRAGVDETPIAPNLSQPFPLRPRPNGELAAERRRPAPESSQPPTATEDPTDSSSQGPGEWQRKYSGKGKGRVRDLDKDPKIFSLTHISYDARAIDFRQTIDDDIVRAVMADSLREWQDYQQRLKSSGSKAILSPPSKPSAPVVRSVLDSWREGPDPFQESKEIENSSPKSQSTDGRQPEPGFGTLRRCWAALKETLDAFSIGWDVNAFDDTTVDPSTSNAIFHQAQRRSSFDEELEKYRAKKHQRCGITPGPEETGPSIHEMQPPSHDYSVDTPRSRHFDSLTLSPPASASSRRSRRAKRKAPSTHPARTSVQTQCGIDHAYSTDDDNANSVSQLSPLSKILNEDPQYVSNDHLQVFMHRGQHSAPPRRRLRSGSQSVDYGHYGGVRQHDGRATGPIGAAEARIEPMIRETAPVWDQNPRASDPNESRHASRPVVAVPPQATTGYPLDPPQARVDEGGTPESYPEWLNDHAYIYRGRRSQHMRSDRVPARYRVRRRELQLIPDDVSMRSGNERQNDLRAARDFSNPRLASELEAVAREQRDNERRQRFPYKLRFTAGRQMHNHTRSFAQSARVRRRPHLDTSALQNVPHRGANLSQWIDEVELRSMMPRGIRNDRMLPIEHGAVPQVPRIVSSQPEQANVSINEAGQGEEIRPAGSNESLPEPSGRLSPERPLTPPKKQRRSCFEACTILSAAVPEEMNATDFIELTFRPRFQANPGPETDYTRASFQPCGLGEVVQRAPTELGDTYGTFAISTADEVQCRMARMGDARKLAKLASQARYILSLCDHAREVAARLENCMWHENNDGKMNSFAAQLNELLNKPSWKIFASLAQVPSELRGNLVAPQSSFTDVTGFLYDIHCLHNGVSRGRDFLEARNYLHESMTDTKLRQQCQGA